MSKIITAWTNGPALNPTMTHAREVSVHPIVTYAGTVRLEVTDATTGKRLWLTMNSSSFDLLRDEIASLRADAEAAR